MITLPHPIPYQGSKRRLAPEIFRFVGDRRFDTLYEPFAGSAAITIAASYRDLAQRYVVADSLDPLIAIWKMILDDPDSLSEAYDRLWCEQEAEPREHFNRVRSEYNEQGGAARLLYLLARCVKNAPRWNKAGGFSQSADHRRKGMQPSKMRAHIGGCHALLSGKASAITGDAACTVESACSSDLVYLDPPWQGTSSGPDTRYHQGLDRERLEVLLGSLNDRGVPWLLSYDGRHGGRVYGPPLSASLVGEHIELVAGRSSQATLNGRSAETVESLYVSRSLMGQRGAQRQLELVAA